MIYDLLSAKYADIGENKCETVMVKVAFLITNTPMALKCGYYVNIPEGFLKHKYY